MTDMRKYGIYAALVIMASALFSCEKLPEEVQICGVGCKTDVIDVSWNGGDCSAAILSTGVFTATIPEGDNWIVFKDAPSSGRLEKDGDAVLVFTLEVNRSIPRSTVISLKCGTATSSFTIRQDGLLEGGLDVEQKNVLVPSEGGRSAAKISTKVDVASFTFKVAYQEEESTDWLSGVHLSGNFLVFDVEPNLDPVLIRHADITASYPGGKGMVHVTQYGAGSDTESISISDLKLLLSQKGTLELDRHYIISGIVINDDREGNGAENRLISVDTSDPGFSSTILYMQSEDGTDGLKLLFKGSCANVASRFDRVSFDAFGLTLRRDDAPVRYEIADIPVSAVTESQRTAGPDARNLTLATLTDKDLYTLVRLEDVEIPVRKGPFVPIDVRFYDLVPAYPMVLRDIAGNSIYMMVNTDCTWSRDGSPMPQGSGSVTGVLVHETSDNFEWDQGMESTLKKEGVISDYISGLGNIGNWQIRPVFRSDVRLGDNLEDGFSSLLCEWRYCDSLGVNLVANYNGADTTLYPTWPAVDDPMALNASLRCTDGKRKIPLKLCNDFTQLGPYSYGGYITRPENGNGVYDATGRNAQWYFQGGELYGVVYSQYTVNSTNWTISNGAAWCVAGWSSSQYWCAEFSTEELTAENAPLSVQFGTFNHVGYTGAPRYWAVEWSSDGTAWKRLSTYSVPDFPASTSRKPYQMPGPKYVSVNLPEAALGLSKVYVRLIPASATGIGTSTAYYSATGSINSGRYNALNYFAVRYNKTIVTP